MKTTQGEVRGTPLDPARTMNVSSVDVDGPSTRPVAEGSTRAKVADSILEHGPSTAGQLAQRLGLTAAAVRRHLDGLAADGLVAAQEERVYGARGRGRPAKVFSLTDAGRGQFYTAYDAMAIDALAYLADAMGDKAVRDFATQRASQVENRYRAIVADCDDGVTPAQALAQALTGEGYSASTREAAHGEQLCQHNCPVAHVAERFPQLCEAETEVFSRLLGVRVQRLATIAHGDGVCTTHIPTLTDLPDPHLSRTTSRQDATSRQGATTPRDVTAMHDTHPQPRKAIR